MESQIGYGLPHYQSSVVFQRGHGLGGVLGRFIKSILPIVKKPIVKRTLKRIGKTVLKTGVSAVNDTINNPSSKFKENLKKHAKSNLAAGLSVSPVLNEKRPFKKKKYPLKKTQT